MPILLPPAGHLRAEHDSVGDAAAEMAINNSGPPPPPRTPRLSASISSHGSPATVELASIMTAASHPVSPGPANSALETRAQDFVPPARPSSTPFPRPELRSDELRFLRLAEGGSTDEEDNDGAGYGAGYSDLPDQKADLMDRGRDGDADADDHMDEAVELEDANTANFGVGAGAGIDSDMIIATETTMATLPALSPLSAVGSDFFNVAMDGLVHEPPASLERVPTPPPSHLQSPPRQQTLFLHKLPMEIQELILDHVFGSTVSPMAKSLPDKRLTRLACISPVWRVLIQERIYCRIKLKATGAAINEARAHFDQHPFLRTCVKHVELWFPVFQPRAIPPSASSSAAPAASMAAIRLAGPVAPTMTHDALGNACYVLPLDNCSMEEAFHFVGRTFPDATVLTLEGGERKKAPQVRHFARQGSVSAIPALANVRTLICKGQWNLIRSRQDFDNIAAALPQMQEWQASYSKPKSKSYLSMATILPNLPANLTSLELCLEGDYRQEITFPPYFMKVTNAIHFCTRLAEATPALQHLSYTGRVCRSFFDVAARLADPRTSRLQSVELTVKNCCRHANHWQELGSGITDAHFIRAFEALVLSAVRSLARLSRLDHVRIRYVDLEFPLPPLNPFFSIRDGRQASGVWSESIVSELARVRPGIRWEGELTDSFAGLSLGKDGRILVSPDFPKKPVVSIKLSNYEHLRALATM